MLLKGSREAFIFKRKKQCRVTNLGETITVKEVGALETEEKGFCSSMARHSYKTFWAYANEFLIRVTITRGGEAVSFG